MKTRWAWGVLVLLFLIGCVTHRSRPIEWVIKDAEFIKNNPGEAERYKDPAVRTKYKAKWGVDIPPYLKPIPTTDDVRTINKERMRGLRVGMSKQEVLNTMGTETIQTYYKHYFNAEEYITEPDKKITNPYRTEMMRISEGKYFDVLFYYTDVKSRDGAITDDDLTPLVFDDDKLIGWGWSFFEDTAQKYKIELRVR